MIVGLSIFVPLIVTIVIAWFFLRGARRDPDEARLRRVQEEYERSRRDE